LNVLKAIDNQDIVWIEYELFPYLGSFAESRLKKKGIPFIMDYDDAIFHRYDSHKLLFIKILFRSKIDKLLSIAAMVITGSPYLTTYSKHLNNNTIEIPTSINASQYLLNEAPYSNAHKDIFIIGWLGSKTTSVNLTLIRDAFKDFIEDVKAELWLMGYDETQREFWKGLPVKFFEWSADKEKSFLISINVGVMPLFDTPFNRGKCGFKLIQYMAMGKPTISTPLEANIMIDKAKVNYFATNRREWLKSFRLVFGERGKGEYEVNREVVSKFYNSAVNEEKYRILFDSFLIKMKK
jgi:glycosyltransferase involved in cell wall biosynthesis